MIYAIVKNNEIVNVIVADTVDVIGLQKGETVIENDGSLGIGFKLVDGAWVNPNPVVYVPDEEEIISN